MARASCIPALSMDQAVCRSINDKLSAHSSLSAGPAARRSLSTGLQPEALSHFLAAGRESHCSVHQNTVARLAHTYRSPLLLCDLEVSTLPVTGGVRPVGLWNSAGTLTVPVEAFAARSGCCPRPLGLVRVPGLGCWLCLPFLLPAHTWAHGECAVAQALGALLPTWETSWSS